MYCPKCSQQQVSEEMRFCSGCGFPLSGVRELIVSGGGVVNPGSEAPALQSRGQRSVRRGAWVMLASLAMAMSVGFITAMDDDFAVFLLLPILGFIIGFVLVLYGALVADKRAARKKATSALAGDVPVMTQQLGVVRNRQLSPPQFVPADTFAVRRAQTAEMVQPGSVTENTTRLLEDDSELRRG